MNRRVASDNKLILRARYVAPLDRPTIEDGAVTVAGDRIAAVGSVRDVRAASLPAAEVDLGDVVLLPGFVNAHTHLELSHLAGLVPPRATDSTRPSAPPLLDWLECLMATRMELGEDDETARFALERGLAESLAAGVTTIGDITRLPDLTRRVLRDGSARVVSFGEVTAVGTRRHLLAERLAAAIDRTHASDRLTIALSPHAPYSLEPDGLRACADAARRGRLRVCIHVAESEEEEEFTLRRSGPFCDGLKRLGIWDDAVPCSGLRPVALLDHVGLLGPRTVLAHANYVHEDDIELIAARGAHVAYCPRTHAAFGHAPHPWRRMLARGVNVCIGTDSLASNPSLSVLDEIRFLHAASPDVPAQQLFEMATIRGARALGLESVVGSLAVGKYADLETLPIRACNDDVLAAVLNADCSPRQVWIDGRAVAR